MNLCCAPVGTLLTTNTLVLYLRLRALTFLLLLDVFRVQSLTLLLLFLVRSGILLLPGRVENLLVLLFVVECCSAVVHLSTRRIQ